MDPALEGVERDLVGFGGGSEIRADINRGDSDCSVEVAGGGQRFGHGG
jgi:hypothetical protein